MDQSSPDFFHGTQKESLSITFLRFWISGVVPEIFAIKVESCHKSRWISDVFLLSQILGGRSSKSYTHVMTPVARHVVWKMFCGDTPTSPEVIVAKTMNFKTNFKFSRLKFFGEDPRPTSGVRYQGLGNLYRVYKFQGAAPPRGWNIVSPKNPLGWLNSSQ